MDDDERNRKFKLKRNISKYHKIYNKFKNAIFFLRIIYLMLSISITRERNLNKNSYSS